MYQRDGLEGEISFATQVKSMSVDELEKELDFCGRARGRNREAKVAYELLKRLKELK